MNCSRYEWHPRPPNLRERVGAGLFLALFLIVTSSAFFGWRLFGRYDNQVSPYYAAARLWTDAIIDPLETRTWISMGIEAANHAPIEKKFNMGVIQV